LVSEPKLSIPIEGHSRSHKSRACAIPDTKRCLRIGTVGKRAVQVPASTCYKELLKFECDWLFGRPIYDTTSRLERHFLPEVTSKSSHYFRGLCDGGFAFARAELNDGRKNVCRHPRSRSRSLPASVVEAFHIANGEPRDYTWRVYRHKSKRLPLHAAIYYFCHYARPRA